MVQVGDEPDDYALMRQLASGEEAALATLFDRYGSLVFTLCERILGDRQHAEDTLLEVFWELWEKAAKYRPERGAPRTYLMILARSRSIDRRRRRERAQISSTAGDDTISRGEHANNESTPPQSAIRTEQRQLVSEALRNLDEVQQRMLQMSFFDGLSHYQISEQLGVPLGTVKTRIRTGLTRLRDRLRKSFSELDEA